MGFMTGKNGILHGIQIVSIFLILVHFLIPKTENTTFSPIEITSNSNSEESPQKKCNKTSLEENNKTPIQCNNNYCSNSSLFFTTSFPSFGFEKFMDPEIRNGFFLYDDPPYSSFFNSIWIPPKIKM